jgi:hypothetical protein
MPSSSDLGKLAAALSKAQGEITGASKDAKNPHFGNRYADLASVWEACRSALAKHEIAVVQIPTADGAKVTVDTMLIHASGEYVSGALTIQAKDAGPQSIGSAVTYARRYGLSALVGVAPEDDDAEAAEGRASGIQAGRPAQPQRSNPVPSRNVTTPPARPMRPAPPPLSTDIKDSDIPF